MNTINFSDYRVKEGYKKPMEDAIKEFSKVSSDGFYVQMFLGPGTNSSGGIFIKKGRRVETHYRFCIEENSLKIYPKKGLERKVKRQVGKFNKILCKKLGLNKIVKVE